MLQCTNKTPIGTLLCQNQVIHTYKALLVRPVANDLSQVFSATTEKTVQPAMLLVAQEGEFLKKTGQYLNTSMPRAKIKCVLTCLVIIIHVRMNRGAIEKKSATCLECPKGKRNCQYYIELYFIQSRLSNCKNIVVCFSIKPLLYLCSFLTKQFFSDICSNSFLLDLGPG